MALLVAKLSLLLLAGWGFWTLWGFPYTNGLLGMLKELSLPGAYLPGPTRIPVKQHYTGIKFLDDQLVVLVGFFYTAIDGNRADVSLSFLDLGAQVIAAWVLMVTESFRWGNKGKWYITSTTAVGLLIAKVGFACIIPLWAALQLHTSPTVFAAEAHDFVASPVQLAVAPISVMVGFGLPSIMMVLAAPSIISYETKQNWTAAQQAWPIWIAITQMLLTSLIAIKNPLVSVLTEEDKKAKTVKYLRLAYVFALGSAAMGHLTAWGLSLLAFAFPTLLSEKYSAMMQPSVVFGLKWPFPPTKAATLADGALWFLQWDLFTGAAATLIWALTLRIAAKKESGLFYQWILGFIKVGVICLAVGPCGAAVVAVWGRDELVFRRAAAEKKAAKKSM